MAVAAAAVLPVWTALASDQLVLVESTRSDVWSVPPGTQGTLTGWVMQDGRYYQICRRQESAVPEGVSSGLTAWVTSFCGRVAPGASTPQPADPAVSRSRFFDAPGLLATARTVSAAGMALVRHRTTSVAQVGPGLLRLWSDELLCYRPLLNILLLAALFSLFAYVYLHRIQRRMMGRLAATETGISGGGVTVSALDGGLSAEPHLAGSLASISLGTVMQMLESERDTGRLVVRDARGRDCGAVWFEEGVLRDAAAGNEHGAEAIYRLVSCTGGDFRFESGERFEGVPTIEEGLMSLLLEAHRRMDEEATRKAEEEVARPAGRSWRLRLRPRSWDSAEAQPAEAVANSH